MVWETGIQSKGMSYQRLKKKGGVLDVSLFNTQHYKVWIKGKWSKPGKGVAAPSIPQCSNYWKESLSVSKLTYLELILK